MPADVLAQLSPPPPPQHRVEPEQDHLAEINDELDSFVPVDIDQFEKDLIPPLCESDDEDADGIFELPEEIVLPAYAIPRAVENCDASDVDEGGEIDPIDEAEHDVFMPDVARDEHQHEADVKEPPPQNAHNLGADENLPPRANDENGPPRKRARLSESDICVLYASYISVKTSSPAMNQRTFHTKVRQTYSKICKKPPPDCRTVKSRCTRWQSNNDERTPRKNTYKRKRLLLSEKGQEDLRRALKENQMNFRGMAASGMQFESRKTGNNGEPILVTPSRSTIARVSKDGGQQLSYPKVRRIAQHTPHHERARCVFCEKSVAKGRQFCEDQHFSDEKPLFYALLQNPRNGVIVVDAGERPTTNITRIGTSGTKKAFSLYWQICRTGVVCYKLYVEGFTMPFYSKVLQDCNKPAMEAHLQEGKPFSRYCHDGCSGGRNHPYDILKDVFGEGKFTTHAAPPCKKDTGRTFEVRFTNKRGTNVVQKRRVFEACDPCECIFEDGQWPAHSPELNPCENAQNELVRRIHIVLKQNNGLHWRGSVKDRMRVVDEAIKNLNDDKDYFKKLFGSLWQMYQKVIASKGALLPN